MNRREFLKSIEDELSFPLILTPDAENKHRLVKVDWDNRTQYQVLKNPKGERTWEKKSFYEIVTDINRGVAELQKLSYGNFIPSKHIFSIGIPPSRKKLLKNKNNLSGTTIEQYIKDVWPKSEFWGHRIATSFLEDSGCNGSAEFFVMWNYEFDNNGEPLACFAFSQYGI